MDKAQIKAFIAARVAKELKDGDVVNLGIGLPTLVPAYLPENVHVILQSENGTIGTGPVTDEHRDPFHVVDAGGSPSAAAPGACFIDSASSFALIRGGHVDATILGGLEVDEEGSLANWIIPGKKMPGMGGAMDLLVGAKNVIVAMEHTAKGKPKILKKCKLPYTAVKCITKIITEMGVMLVTPEGLLLTEYNPEFTVEQIQEATEASLLISPELKPIALVGAECTPCFGMHSLLYSYCIKQEHRPFQKSERSMFKLYPYQFSAVYCLSDPTHSASSPASCFVRSARISPSIISSISPSINCGSL